MATSRIGRKPVVFPAGVDVKIHDQQLSAKGPKGQLAVDLHPFVNVTVENNEINVQVRKDGLKPVTGANTKLYLSILGTTRANINNLIQGITKGFEKKLVFIGVGYRAQLKGKVLSLSLGHSYPIEFPLPEGITAELPTPTEINIKGADKRQVGETAAQIRRVRPVERYKGKGVRYANEKVELKETKKK